MADSPPDDSVRNVVIIGSGPAGLTAAIYTSRATLEPLVLEGEPSSTSDQPGGQLMLTTEVENYPGFPEGVMGPELMMDFKAQAQRFGAEVQTVKVSKVDLSERPFKIWVGDPEAAEPTHLAKTVIVSTGAQSIMLNLDRETELIGHGVSTCATCDGFFFRDHDIAVIGGGDSALEEATFLSRFASKVYLVVRRDELRASKIMQERAIANPKIEFVWNASVVEYVGESKLEKVMVRNNLDDSISELAVTGLFIAIGHKPNTSLFQGQLDMKENGYLLTTPGRTATNIPGVFASGDVQDDYYRQAVTAAGSGCQAALEAERWLEEQEH
jgi:thioredoxin reductase (NADPH)